MRKLIYIPVILTFQVSLIGQPFGAAAEGYRISELVYENANGEKGITCFIYDGTGRLIKGYWSLLDGSRSSVNIYEYDRDGNIIAAYRDFTDSLTSNEFFLYDSEGRKLAEYFYRSDGVSGYAEYSYELGRLTAADFYDYKGWLNGEVKYEYEKDRPVFAKMSSDGETICSIEYNYDDTGSLVREHWDFAGKWNQTFTYKYEKVEAEKQYYTNPLLTCSKPYRIKHEGYTFNGEKGGPSFYNYNNAGLLSKKVFVRSDGVETNTYYEYDESGRLISSERIFADGGKDNFKYQYDENGRLVMRIFYRKDTLAGFESYLYNGAGELIEAYLKNFDAWLTGRITFKRDSFGKIAEGFFKGEDGFDAVILYDYNREGLAEKIKWDFSFGKYQIYKFEYETE